MRKSFAIALMITIFGSGFYVYHEVRAVCGAPLAYRVGNIDERFTITEAEIRVAISDAESVWEQATGRNLFTYDSKADFAINFVFDDRQAFAEAEIDFRQRLDASEGVNSAIGETYEILIERYQTLEREYKTKVASYEQRLDEYNEKVNGYNEDGGAPQAAYKELEIERSKLDSELKTINELGEKLNDLVKQINIMSNKGNELIETYNQKVSQYNEQFGTSREFTQGDYQDKEINIYKFTDGTELRLVLAHELGHALSLDHVAGETSVMYDHLGAQPDQLALSGTDILEFERICGQTTRSFIERLFIRFGL